MWKVSNLRASAGGQWVESGVLAPFSTVLDSENMSKHSIQVISNVKFDSIGFTCEHVFSVSTEFPWQECPLTSPRMTHIETLLFESLSFLVGLYDFR